MMWILIDADYHLLSQIQGVPRRVLQVILSIESGLKIQKQQPAQKEQASSRLGAIHNPARTSQRSAGSERGRRALAIISEESGIATSDLTDSTVFADVGIDSLLSLTISARFKEELELELDFDALFSEYPTVGDLKALLGGTWTMTAAASSTDSPRSSATGITTPETDESCLPLKVDFRRALEIISEESGVAIEEFTDDTNFSDSGVDSLLSLVIVSRYRNELDLDISHESLFLECPTVADLRQALLEEVTQPPVENKPTPPLATEIVDVETKRNVASCHTKTNSAALAERKQAVDALVQIYTAKFSGPVSASWSLYPPRDHGAVVLITGASGSLGSHLVYHLAQLPEISKIVCLNRENKAEPYTRQLKAMREKGIRFPEALKPKLLVLQIDSSKPQLGLSSKEYDELVRSVTHLIHNAWPMSAKRALSGFESQFQIMRNLIDFARDVVSGRPDWFKFSFQMVSSIGVVGHYGLDNDQGRTVVPEDRVGIDSVLPNGYGDAKWGCERMLDETLHRYPERFRTMAVRLGQIAGSKTSGYWNPMEHFGFLIKSSQTLNALPDVDGTVYWTPVNDVAATLSDLISRTALLTRYTTLRTPSASLGAR